MTGNGSPQALRIALHAGEMALPGEQNAVIYADGRENAPAVEQSDLAGRHHAVTGIADLIVVEQEAMHAYQSIIQTAFTAGIQTDFTAALTGREPTGIMVSSGDGRCGVG